MTLSSPSGCSRCRSGPKGLYFYNPSASGFVPVPSESKREETIQPEFGPNRVCPPFSHEGDPSFITGALERPAARYAASAELRQAVSWLRAHPAS